MCDSAENEPNMLINTDIPIRYSFQTMGIILLSGRRKRRHICMTVIVDRFILMIGSAG
jgi:hypothetical protein